MAEGQTLAKVAAFGELVRVALDAAMVILFGSHARGDNRAERDVDVAVVVDEVRGTILRTGRIVHARDQAS